MTLQYSGPLHADDPAPPTSCPPRLLFSRFASKRPRTTYIQDRLLPLCHTTRDLMGTRRHTRESSSSGLLLGPALALRLLLL